MRGRRGDGEAVTERDRHGRLEPRDLDHASCSGQIALKRRSKLGEHVVCCTATVIALHAVVDLDKVDPADDGAAGDQPLTRLIAGSSPSSQARIAQLSRQTLNAVRQPDPR